VVGHFFNDPNKEQYAQQLSKLYEQFDDRQDITFSAFRPGSRPPSKPKRHSSC